MAEPGFDKLHEKRAAHFHKKLWRIRREASYGWLAGVQFVEEVAAAVALEGDRLSQHIPYLEKWLACDAKDSADHAAGGMGVRTLLDRIRHARNGAVHQQGTASRRLEWDVEAALRIIDEALTTAAGDPNVGYYMIPDVLYAGPDDTLTSVRDMMLRYDISAVPVEAMKGVWKWITATGIAQHRAQGRKMTAKVSALLYERPACIVPRRETAACAAERLASGEPALLVGHRNQVQGIVTAFDLLYANPHDSSGGGG